MSRIRITVDHAVLIVCIVLLILALAAQVKAAPYLDPMNGEMHSTMQGATATSAGKAGGVPAPTSTERAWFLRGDGHWVMVDSPTGGPALSDVAPQATGTAASAGVQIDCSRSDHVHLTPSAAQVGADPAGTAATAVTGHETSYTHTNLPTAGQKAALAGSQGTPSASNTYVTVEDVRLPSAARAMALAGTNGTPGEFNKYVTNSDPRLTDARTPTSHTHSGVYEPVLGNPDTAGYVLSSDATGGRSWAAPGAQTWTPVTTFTRTSDSAFTVTHNAANQAVFAAGRPLRFRTGSGSWAHALVTAYATGTVTLAGAPLAAGTDGMQYGDFTRVSVQQWVIGGYWADVNRTYLLGNLLHTGVVWLQGPAQLVQVRAVSATADSGATAPVLNLTIAGSAALTSGLSVTDTWAASSVGMTGAGATVAFGQALEATVTKGTAGNAADLTIISAWVLK